MVKYKYARQGLFSFLSDWVFFTNLMNFSFLFQEALVSDAGKLFVLDGLLARLKAEGHRVLIYSQMTRMIDLLEEFMHHRKHTYIRLDGSSKIHERRGEFQILIYDFLR